MVAIFNIQLSKKWGPNSYSTYCVAHQANRSADSQYWHLAYAPVVIDDDSLTHLCLAAIPCVLLVSLFLLLFF